MLSILSEITVPKVITLKCLICGEKTDKRILCPKHMNADFSLRFLVANNCNSFMQKDGDMQGVCKWHLSCKPIKNALKHEVLLNNLGHVVCPYASTNLSKIMYSDLNEDEIRNNYPECF